MLTIPKLVLFDWDNTLSMSRETVVTSMNKVLEYYKKDEWNITKKKRDSQKSLKGNFYNFFDEKHEEAYEMYFTEYLKRYKNTSKKPLSSIDLIEYLSRKDIELGIVSNKDSILLENEVDFLYGKSTFSNIVGHDDCHLQKPNPEPVYKATEGLNIDLNPENVWFVGDSKEDIDCAYAANCQPIFIEEKPMDSKYLEHIENLPVPTQTFSSIRDFYQTLVNEQLVYPHRGLRLN